MTKQTAARHLVDALVMNGVTHVFCVPGESYLAVLDALYDVKDRIKLIVCRHEASASNMAEAYGKLTGRPGIVMVTRGPGATQGAVGVHTAFQDSTPMIMFIGQVARDMQDREAFQEIDYRQMFGPVAKWASEIDVAARAGEYVNRAFATAQNGRRGPVVLALPEDMLTEEAEAEPLPPAPIAMAAPDERALELLREHLGGAERPFLLVGGGGWTHDAVNDLRIFVEATGIPVGASVPLERPLRQSPSAICGRCRHRAEPQARRAPQAVGPRHRFRAASWRDDDRRLRTLQGAAR